MSENLNLETLCNVRKLIDNVRQDCANKAVSDIIQSANKQGFDLLHGDMFIMPESAAILFGIDVEAIKNAAKARKVKIHFDKYLDKEIACFLIHVRQKF